MDEFKFKLEKLLEILKEKNFCLTNLYEKTKKQYDLLKSSADYSAIKNSFIKISEEKEKDIKIIIENDEIFKKIFEEIEDEFSININSYKYLLKDLQNEINIATNLDNQIRDFEKRNKNIIKDRLNPFINYTKSKTKVTLNNVSRSYILKQYNKNKTNTKKHNK